MMELVPNLPVDCVVEVTAYVGANGARNVAFGSLPPAERGWLPSDEEHGVIDDRSSCNRRLWNSTPSLYDQPVGRFGETAKRIMDELFIAHEAYLPQFKKTIDRLKEEGIEVKDGVARNLIKADGGDIMAFRKDFFMGRSYSCQSM